jgi:pyruvate ferredoxin oxidoreductase delta subunit
MAKNSSKGGVTSRPTTSNKKSGWRTFKPVVTEKCTGCGICIMHCPEGCIELKKKKASPDYDYCTGCMICMNVCPFKAIEKETED